MSLSGVSAAELRTMIADAEAMRDMYEGGSAYYYGQHDDNAKWLREQLAALEVSS